MTCLFKLSTQGKRNDLIKSTESNNGDSCHGIVGLGPSRIINGNLINTLANMNESVQYHHHGDSCHGHVGLGVDQVAIDDTGCAKAKANMNEVGQVAIGTVVSHSDGAGEWSLRPPSWVHVYSKSTEPSSTRTQAASMAYIETPTHPKGRHRRNRRSKKKLKKQARLLTQVIVPKKIQQNLLSESDIDSDIVVVDGGDDGNPPIRPPDGVTWRCLSVIGGTHLHVQDETNPCLGLTFTRVNSTLPFIRLPRQQSLDICGQVSMKDIVFALEECEKLKKTSLRRSDNKRVFGDYGKRVKYTCAGVQVCRNKREVLNCNSFMEDLPLCHWTILMKLMRHAEYAFESIADNEVMSHMHHAKHVVPFKTMSIPNSQTTPLKYYGALAFGCNVHLPCHTDDDFTMSMVQVHLKGKEKYDVNDDIVVYFCFPTLGSVVPLRPGDFLLFNALIPHCVSSRCRQDDEIMVVSMYLKTSVVGMNNNQLPVSRNQSFLADLYRFAVNN